VLESYHRVYGGRLCAVGDSEGVLEWQSLDDPYGGEPLRDASVPGFASLFGDPETGLWFAGSRWYDPSLAAFTTPDSWFGCDPGEAVPSAFRRVLRGLPGGTDVELTPLTAYAWCGYDPVNLVDRNGHSAGALAWSIFSSLFWELHLTTLALEIEFVNILLEPITWLISLFKWDAGWGWKYSIFNIAPPVGSERIGAFGLILNGLLRIRNGAWTLGNVIWASGERLRELDAQSERELAICSNGAVYLAASSGARFLVRNPRAKATGTVPASGEQIDNVTWDPAGPEPVSDGFNFLNFVAVRKAGVVVEPVRYVESVAGTSVLIESPSNPLVHSALDLHFRGRVVDIKADDEGISGSGIVSASGEEVDWTGTIPTSIFPSLVLTLKQRSAGRVERRVDNVAANVIRLDTPLDAAFFEQVVDVQGGNDAGSATVAPNGATLVWSDPAVPASFVPGFALRIEHRADEQWRRVESIAANQIRLQSASHPMSPPPLGAEYRGPVEIARLDESFLELKKGDHEALRAIRFVRGQALHLSSQLEEDFPTTALQAAEVVPKRTPHVEEQVGFPIEFSLLRLKEGDDRAPFTASAFVRVTHGDRRFARAVTRTLRTRDVEIDSPLPSLPNRGRYTDLDLVKLAQEGAPVAAQRAFDAARERITLGDLRRRNPTPSRYDGLEIDNGGAAPVVERRIIRDFKLGLEIDPLPAALHAVDIALDRLTATNVTSNGEMTGATGRDVKLTAALVARFPPRKPVRVRTIGHAPNEIEAFGVVDSVVNSDTLRLGEAIPAADFGDHVSVSVTLLESASTRTPEQAAAPGGELVLPGDGTAFTAGEGVRVRLTADTDGGVVRKLRSVLDLAVLDSALPVSHAANLNVKHCRPVDGTSRGRVTAPDARYELDFGHGHAYVANDLVIVRRNDTMGLAEVASVTVTGARLARPLEGEYGGDQGIVTTTIAERTGTTTPDASLASARVLVPADMNTQLTTREALEHHELQHVWQGAVWGPFLLSLPLPWLAHVGFSFSKLAEAESHVAKHISVGGVDSVLSLLFWGMGGAEGSITLPGIVEAGLASISLRPPGPQAEKALRFTGGARVTIKKVGEDDNTRVLNFAESLGPPASPDDIAFPMRLRFNLAADSFATPFAAGDAVEVSMSPFEQVRNTVNQVFNPHQLWIDHVPTAWGRALLSILNHDAWLPFVGVYFLSLYAAGGNFKRLPGEQEASYQSGELYTSIVIGEPHEIFVGQFSRVYAFIEGRGGGLRTYEEPEYLLEVELPNVPNRSFEDVARDVQGTELMPHGRRVHFHSHRLLPIIDRAANVVGAVFSSAQPGTYRLICPGQLPRNQDVVLKGAHSVEFLEKAQLRVRALGVEPDATRDYFETETIEFRVQGDSSATYALRLPTTGPTAAGSVSGLRYTAPILTPAEPDLEQPVEITARYPANHPVFNGPGQRNALTLPAEDLVNRCQTLRVKVRKIPAPALGPTVRAGTTTSFEMPIAPAGVRVTSPRPTEATTPAVVRVRRSGRPSTLEFVAPDHVSEARPVTIELTFGADPAHRKVMLATVDVLPPQAVTASWMKNLTAVGTREVRTDEVVELAVEVRSADFALDRTSALRFYILESGRPLGTDDSRVTVLNGTGVTASPAPFRNQARRTTFRSLDAGQTLRQAVDAFKADSPADFFEQILVLERAGQAPTYHVIAFWRATALDASSRHTFTLDFPNRHRIESTGDPLHVVSTAVSPAEVLARTRVRVEGRALDSDPLVAAQPEPLEGLSVSGGGQSVSTPTAGTFTLEGLFVLGTQKIRLHASGADVTELRLTIQGDAAGPLTLVLEDLRRAREIARVAHPGAVNETTPINVNAGDVGVLVHKVRGVVRWPDSRVLNAPNYQGTPLSGKRVFLLPLEPGESAPQRPATSKAWEALRARPGVMASGRPGRAQQREATTDQGAFELKFVDLTPGRQYLAWVEGEVSPGRETPDYLVRSLPRVIRRLTGATIAAGGRMSTFLDERHSVIEHDFNLTRDVVSFGVEVLRIVQRPDGAGTVVRVVRPTTVNKAGFDNGTAEEALEFDAPRKLVRELPLACLPLVPLGEPREAQGPYTREVCETFLQEQDRVFTRKPVVPRTNLLLDSRKIERSLTLSAGAWDAAWAPGDVGGSTQRRLCELLEKTFIVLPSIADLGAIAAPLWYVDVASLSDHGIISVPPHPDNVIARRTLDQTFVPMLAPTRPRLIGVASKRVLLGPGHGFFDAAPPSVALANWQSERGGYLLRAGEDDLDSLMAAEVARLVRLSSMLVDSVREIDDLTLPGVEHLANDSFVVSARPGFPRLWQQNPMYFLGHAGSPIVIGTALGQIAGNHNDKGIVARRELALQLATAAPPLDLILFIHNNAEGVPGVARRTTAFFRHVQVSQANAAEANTVGEEFATRVRDEIVGRAHTRSGAVMDLAGANSDLDHTFHHFKNGALRVSTRPVAAPAPLPAGWQEEPFPLQIPSALIEVGFFTTVDEAALLSRAWWRRLACEAMAIAIEGQLRADPGAIQRSVLVALLGTTFGPTAAIRALTADATLVAVADIDSMIQAATGETVRAFGASLHHAIVVVETARDAYTRSTFVTELRDAIAEAAGYDPADAAAAADIDTFVTRAILSGDALGALNRSGEPITRGEAGELVAAGLGFRPANLQSVLDHDADGVRLMEPLQGAPHPDAYLSRLDAREIMTRIRRVDPRHLYRAVEVLVETETGGRVPRDKAGRFLVRAGTRLRWVATTDGSAWRAAAADITISLVNGAGTRQTVTLQQRTRERIESQVWAFVASGVAVQTFLAEFRVRHPSAGDRAVASSRVTFVLLL
jgi:RHS repeat-associated protein